MTTYEVRALEKKLRANYAYTQKLQNVLLRIAQRTAAEIELVKDSMEDIVLPLRSHKALNTALESMLASIVQSVDNKTNMVSVPLSELNLSTRAYNQLRRAGIANVLDLLQFVGYTDRFSRLVRIGGVSVACAEEIIAALEKHEASQT